MPSQRPQRASSQPRGLYSDRPKSAPDYSARSAPAKQSMFVTITKWGGRTFRGMVSHTKFTPEEADIFRFLGFDVSSDDYRSTYRGITVFGLALGLALSALLFAFGGIGDILIFGLIAAVLVLIPAAAGFLYLRMPFSMAEKEKQFALAYTPEIVNYLVMSMRLTPNLEKAVEFAASHGRGKIAEDLKELLWRAQIGEYLSVEEGLDELAYRWGPYSEEFKHALMLIRSSVIEADTVRRNEMLERASADVLEGSKEKMDIYARQLNQPTVYLYYFGVLLPLMLAIILPIAGAMTGLAIAKAEYLFIIYNLLIPFGVYAFGSNILGSRPPTYVPPTIPDDFPGLPRKGIWEIGSIKVPYKAAALAVFALFLASGFFLDQYAVNSIESWQNVDEVIKGMTHIPFLYDSYRLFVGQFTIAGILLGISLAISVYLFGKYSARKAVQDEVRAMETEFKDALYVLASRLGENRPMEEALRQAVEFLPKSKIASDVFRRILDNISSLGMTVETAIFDPTFGAIRNYPSQIIRGGLRIMVDSVELGVNVAAKSLISLSMQIRNQQKIDEMLRKLLSDVTMMLSTMATFIAPIVLAVVSALQRMVTSALASSCANQTAASAPASGSMGGLSSVASFCTGDITQVSADPATFILIMGLYSAEIVILLTYFNSQIEDTNNDLHTYMSIATSLPVAMFIYVAAAFVVGTVISAGS